MSGTVTLRMCLLSRIIQHWNEYNLKALKCSNSVVSGDWSWDLENIEV